MKKRAVTCIVLISVICAFAFGGGQKEATDKVVEWRFPTLESGPGTWASDVISDFAEAVRQRTNGRLNVHVYYGGELGIKPTDFLTAMQQGAIQAAHGSTAYWAKEIEGCAISAMPLVAVGSYDETVKLHDGLRDFINKQLEEKYRVRILWMIPWEFVQPLTNRKIENYADLQGMKLRVSGLLTGELIKACNGVPVAMPLSEAYTSLSRRVIDGAVVSIPSLEHGNMHEVAKYVHFFYYHSAAAIYLMSLDALEALPKDVQQIVLEEAARVEAKGVADASIGMRRGEEFAKSMSKLELLYPTPEQLDAVREKVKPLWDDWFRGASPEAQKHFVDALARTGVTYRP